MKRNIDKQLRQWQKKEKRKPLVLLGARQIGKTHSLKQFGNDNFKNHFYINFERQKEYQQIFEKDLKPQRIISELEILFNQKIDIKTDLIIFDEIQDCPKAITSLKYFCEEVPKLAICAAGSLLGVNLSQSSFPVGKINSINMYPLSFFEFIEAIGEHFLFKYLTEWSNKEDFSEAIHQKTWELWKIYLIVGGLPEAILSYIEYKKNLITALHEVRKCQETLIQTHLADIARHSGKENSMHLERLWSNIPAQLAKEQNGSAPKFKFKGVISNLNSYERMSGTIDWLEAAGLILKVPIVNCGQLPFKAYTEENRFKLFVYDVGILGALSDLNPQLILNYDYGTYKGFYAENFIAQEFSCAEGRRDRLFAWKEGESEVEFLKEVSREVIPVEVKSGNNTRSRSIQIFQNKYNSSYKVIFCAKNFGSNDEKKLNRYPIYMAARFPIDKVDA